MFCMKCGKELPDDANFCFVCGTSIEKVQPSIKEFSSSKLRGKFIINDINDWFDSNAISLKSVRVEYVLGHTGLKKTSYNARNGH